MEVDQSWLEVAFTVWIVFLHIVLAYMLWQRWGPRITCRRRRAVADAGSQINILPSSSNLTVEGLPRIIRMATLFIVPRVEPYVDRATAALLVDVLARLVISYFLAPSALVDLGEAESARRVIRAYVLPAIQTEPSITGARP
jgi:hypothetical protein